MKNDSGGDDQTANDTTVSATFSHTNVFALNNGRNNEEPRTGTAFGSEENVTRYYTSYAKQMGFGVGKISSKNSDDGKKYFTLACNCARKYVSTSTNPSKQYLTLKTQCRARLNACIALDGTITV
ncbi:unnamed protein product [Vicia faba]|uniref:Protein FAR1-RELATED SEQUENCE n=1 Tax=Vicia faba TaxID=3906 RepID=A0AAV0ZZQ5_VICFA|nr:unnamed protein product [Vicia faba]